MTKTLSCTAMFHGPRPWVGGSVVRASFKWFLWFGATLLMGVQIPAVAYGDRKNKSLRRHLANNIRVKRADRECSRKKCFKGLNN